MEPHLYAQVLIQRTENTSLTGSRDLLVFFPVIWTSTLSFSIGIRLLHHLRSTNNFSPCTERGRGPCFSRRRSIARRDSLREILPYNLDPRQQGFLLPGKHHDSRRNTLALTSIIQRYPKRVSHGDASSDKAGTETTSDVDAELYYHRVGTPQCERFPYSRVL